jgi:TIR domain
MNTLKSAFISHSTTNDSYVAELESFLRRLGYTKVFNDVHSIQPDEQFWPSIEQGIRGHDDLIVVITTASAVSDWVRREVEFARSLNKIIIPIWIEDCALPATFADRDVIDFRPSNRTKLIQRLSPPRFIHHAAEHFLGREPQLALLDEAWTNGTNVLSIIAWGGVGKTALITEWVQTRFIDKQWKTDDGQPALASYFDWTFYDQGTRSLADGTEARTGSVGDFFEQALLFFDDPSPNLPGKGRRLANLIRQQRSLLILDGVEPLQQPPGHPQAGRLLDPDLRDLLAALAQSNPGLCLLTSRQALTDLHSLRRTAHKEHELEDLPVPIAILLLRQLQIKGTDQELAGASEKFGCHALSLTLLGRYLFDAHSGDIARTDRIRDLQHADILTREDRHRTAWLILETYENWLATAQADGNPKTLAILRLTGLFDRTATADCLAALPAEPIIPGLTNAICGMADDEWNILLKRLERAHLIKLRELQSDRSSSSVPRLAFDAHPLLREYFAKRLKLTQPEAFKTAHSLLFDHLCQSTEDRPDTLEKLQPLYDAVYHGCLSNRHEESRSKVYRDRILRGTSHDGFFSTRKLGAYNADLAALAAFFDKPWTRINPNLSPANQTWLMNQAVIRLRAIGRLSDATEVTAIPGYIEAPDNEWKGDALSAMSANNLCVLNSKLGDLDGAIFYGHKAIQFADKSNHKSWPYITRSMTADALLNRGKRNEAELLFAEAEIIQAKREPKYPYLYSLPGACYADFLLSQSERVTWSVILKIFDPSRDSLPYLVEELANTGKRSRMWFDWRSPNDSIGSIGYDYLILSRFHLYKTILSLNNEIFIADVLPRDSPTPPEPLSEVVKIVISHFREANQLEDLPRALLTAALYHGTLGENLEETERLLEEAQQISERGPMPLYLADVHLHRARLFGRLPKNERQTKFPEIDPKAELAEARRLIEKHGYWRRKEELEDAETAAINW